MKPIIDVQNLSKKYLIHHEASKVSDTLREAIGTKIKSFCRMGKKAQKSTSEEFWALRDLTFSIQQGDRVGVIGRNGAGKSTLLKVLSRITEPTKGTITIHGRVASLLEVGTGFHPDLTARENIFLNGVILGMSRREIAAKFDQIVDFAELEQFLDTPVKRFSSGMYTKLGFAIAAHLETDLLIVDEVLAVGDIQFQEKCIKKMNEMGTNGRTILFVSHHVGSILALCNKGLYLEKGQVKAFGTIENCISQYISSCPHSTLSWQGIVGDENILISGASLNKEFFYHGEEAVLDLDYEILKPQEQLILGVAIWNGRNQLLAKTRIFDEQALKTAGRHRASLHLEVNLFHEGEYLIKVDCILGNKKQVVTDEIALKFPVYASQKNGLYRQATEREGISLGNKWTVVKK